MAILKEAIVYILVLAVLLRDSFHQWTIWSYIPQALFYIVVVVLLLVCFYPTKKLSLMHNFWMQLRVIVVTLVVIVALPFFGGRSAIGLDVREPIFVIVIILSFFQLSMQHKRAKQQVAREKEIEKQLQEQKK